MSDEPLRTLIREKVVSGALPRVKCQITWFGPGSSQPCVACEAPIAREDVECECEHPDATVIRFHRLCFALWDEVREALA
jgi:hypothetical protein